MESKSWNWKITIVLLVAGIGYWVLPSQISIPTDINLKLKDLMQQYESLTQHKISISEKDRIKYMSKVIKN
jgi:hypothetical protein